MYCVLRKKLSFTKIALIIPLLHFLRVYRTDERYYFMLTGSKVNGKNKTHEAIKIVTIIAVC